MAEFAARVRRVRMKDGADVHVLDMPKRPDGLAGTALEGARLMADDASPVIAYMLVGLHADGGVTRSGATEFPEEGIVNRYVFAGMVTEITRAHLVTQQVACDVYNRDAD